MPVEGSTNSRWRRDEFADTDVPVDITAESHTIALVPEFNKFGFFTNESVQQESPSSVVVVEDDSALTPLTEVTSPPSAGQFRVSYDADGFQNTGFFECNASNDGLDVLVAYKGLGTINHPTFKKNAGFNIQGNFSINSGQSIIKISIDDTLAANLDTSIVSEKALRTYIDTQDAATEASALATMDTRQPFRAFVRFTTSGTFNVPSDVSTVFVEVVGGGGGGAGGDNLSTSGGGGGGGEIRRAAVPVTPSAALTVTIGAGGAAGALGGNPGSDGGTTTFASASAIVANGGKGAAFSGANSNSKGGRGGFGGGPAASFGQTGGPGGSTHNAINMFGGFGGGISGGQANNEPGGVGSGGAGGTGNFAGGAGGAGFVLIWF